MRFSRWLLLISMAFSIVHAYAIEASEHDHCSMQAFVQETSAPAYYGDLCDMHFEFHLPFILPENVTVKSAPRASEYFAPSAERFSSSVTAAPYRPPIA